MKSSIKRMVVGLMMFMAMGAYAQTKVDEGRMEQDIEVAENILSTLIRQQSGKRNFFPSEVRGSYTAGFGVTLRMPRSGAFFGMISPGSSYSYSYSYSSSDGDKREPRKAEVKARDAEERAKEAEMKARKDNETNITRNALKAKTVTYAGSAVDRDSLSQAADKNFLNVAKSFMADYGDVLSQLKGDERILITNRGDDFEGGFVFAAWPGGESRRSLVSVEAKKDDISQLKQGKITRDQFMTRLKVVNSETISELEPDLEVLSSMFSRLYREDLSKTYYAQGNVQYERMKDFGVIYYMRVYSSNEDQDHFYMPTVNLRDLSQADRDKKVKELYPQFENGLKDNLLEYGRTLRSLKDEEQVVFKVKLTKCEGCGIPEILELSVKNSVLKDYGLGKISKESALAKVNVKKTGEQ